MYRMLAFVIIPLVLLSVLSPFAFAAPKNDNSDLAGMWSGNLMVMGSKLELLVSVTLAPDGSLSATMASPSQGASGIPVEEIRVKGDSLWLKVPSLRGEYSGLITAARDSLHGTWEQNGFAMPLRLGRTEGGDELLRKPQEPVPPFPYDVEEISFSNAQAGLRLAGTFSKPHGKGPFPAVILISGSGPQDRDGHIMGHKPLFVMADYLNRRGIAVLRYDERGVGASEGEFASATSRDFAGDARAAIDALRKRQDVDRNHIGIIGHSEGGIIAPMLAAGSNDIAFIVLLAAPGLPGSEILLQQIELLNRKSGMVEESIATSLEEQRKVYAILEEESDNERAMKRLRELNSFTLPDNIPADMRESAEKQLQQQIEAAVSPWFRTFIAYDPRPDLQKVACPVLALNGSKDLQVPAAQNLAAIAAALKQGGNARVTTEELTGLNHLLQTADSGLPNEYGRLAETLAPAALERIGNWIRKTCGLD